VKLGLVLTVRWQINKCICLVFCPKFRAGSTIILENQLKRKVCPMHISQHEIAVKCNGKIWAIVWQEGNRNLRTRRSLKNYILKWKPRLRDVLLIWRRNEKATPTEAYCLGYYTKLHMVLRPTFQHLNYDCSVHNMTSSNLSRKFR
jgi:hypothetical protein